MKRNIMNKIELNEDAGDVIGFNRHFHAFIQCSLVKQFTILLLLRPVHTWTTRHDTTACDTTRFFAPHTIKWISSHICSTTKSGRHDKKLLQQISSCVAATVSRKLLKKTVSIGISLGL